MTVTRQETGSTTGEIEIDTNFFHTFTFNFTRIKQLEHLFLLCVPDSA